MVYEEIPTHAGAWHAAPAAKNGLDSCAQVGMLTQKAVGAGLAIAVTLLLWSLALLSGLVAYSVTSVMAGALFSRFTSTTVQILMQKAIIRQLLLCQRMKVCVSSAGLRYANSTSASSTNCLFKSMWPLDRYLST
jgi:hypothetical protein